MFDMQMWGIGSPAVELAYFLASNVDPGDESTEEKIIRLYCSEFNNALPKTMKPIVLKQFCANVRMAQIEFTVAALVRRSKFETPETVAEAIKKQGDVARNLQQVMLDREFRLLERVKRLYTKHGGFDLSKIADVVD